MLGREESREDCMNKEVVVVEDHVQKHLNQYKNALDPILWCIMVVVCIN
jgi:hypothetical protein